jgi:hypothetical protein
MELPFAFTMKPSADEKPSIFDAIGILSIGLPSKIVPLGPQ